MLLTNLVSSPKKKKGVLRMIRELIPDDLYAVIYNRVPRACVDLLVTDEDDKILLTRRDIEPYRNLWHFPGGGIKFKESMAEAANRIAKKEIGVEVEVLKIIGTCEILDDDLPSAERHSISLVLEVRIVSGEVRAGAETKEAMFFAEIPNEMHPYHKAFSEEHRLFV